MRRTCRSSALPPRAQTSDNVALSIEHRAFSSAYKTAQAQAGGDVQAAEGAASTAAAAKADAAKAKEEAKKKDEL
jgi:hypothetical protein